MISNLNLKLQTCWMNISTNCMLTFSLPSSAGRYISASIWKKRKRKESWWYIFEQLTSAHICNPTNFLEIISTYCNYMCRLINYLIKALKVVLFWKSYLQVTKNKCESYFYFYFLLLLSCANQYQASPAIYTKLKIYKKQTFGITMRPAELTSLFLSFFSKRNLNVDGLISWNTRRLSLLEYWFND